MVQRDPPPLGLTRDQLASFLKGPEQIRQFELLFQQVEDIAPDKVQAATIAAGNADARAIQALGQIAQTAQDAAVCCATLDAKVTLALGQIADLAQKTALDLAVVEGRSTLTQDMLSAILTPLQLLATAPAPTPAKRTRYGQFYDTTTQSAAAINTAQAITFNTTDISNGVSIGTPTSRIVVDTEGVYNFAVSIQFDSTGGANREVWVWFRKNGTNVPNSAMYLTIATNNSELLQSFNILLDMKAGDYMEVMFEVADLAAQIAAFAATGVHPAIPSIILTATNNL